MRQCTSQRSSIELQDFAALFAERHRRAGQAIRAVDEHRIFKLGSDGFDDGTQHGHSGATGEVAQPLSDIAAQPAPMLSACVELGTAGPKMAGKASEPFRDAWYPLSYICWDLGAKKSTGSGQVASWFSG